MQASRLCLSIVSTEEAPILLLASRILVDCENVISAATGLGEGRSGDRNLEFWFGVYGMKSGSYGRSSAVNRMTLEVVDRGIQLDLNVGGEAVKWIEWMIDGYRESEHSPLLRRYDYDSWRLHTIERILLGARREGVTIAGYEHELISSVLGELGRLVQAGIGIRAA